MSRTALQNEILVCKVCKAKHKRKDVNDYVYHDSFGVVCLKHHGVKEWYEQLINAANV